MKIITIQQPWASLIARRIKRYETRSWRTEYRGRIAIHADKNCSMTLGEFVDLRKQMRYLGIEPEEGLRMTFGAIIAVSQIKNIRLIDKSLSICLAEELLGDWIDGHFAWQLENVIALKNPIPFRGRQGLTDLPPEIELLCNLQLEEICFTH